MKLKKCPECNTYTLQDKCPKCVKKVKEAHYKFIKNSKELTIHE